MVLPAVGARLALCVAGCCLGAAGALKIHDQMGAAAPAPGEGAAGSQRLPYPWNLVAHVPYTGGTTFRRVLEELAAMRSQNVQLCYKSPECEVRKEELQASIDAEEEHWMPFDNSQENQIVFGHGVTMDFAQKWGLPKASVATVVMVRDPILHMVSQYKHKRLAGEPGVATSFEEWIVSGQMVEAASFIMRFYVPDYDATLPKTEIRKRVESMMGQISMLALPMEEYQESVRRLADFVLASPSEKERLVQSSLKPDGRRLDDFVFSMHKSAWSRFLDDIKPLQFVHDYAVSRVSTENRTFVSVEAKRMKSRNPVISEEGDMVKVIVSGDVYGEEP